MSIFARRHRRRGYVAAAVLAAAGIALALQQSSSYSQDAAHTAGTAAMASAHVVAETPEQAGRYLVLVGGCNDCHTNSFDMNGLQVPESEWLTGSAVGWRGPWGTSYPSNLRLYVQDYSEDVWVKTMHTRNQRPPMPWTGLNSMSEQDLRAMYRYIKSLGGKGQMMPLGVGPDREPATPYVSLMPQQSTTRPAAP